ncbi:MAG: porin family protein [Bacteroidales bacterium]|nr:porin family protein [Bacteroidales bacterium]
MKTRIFLTAAVIAVLSISSFAQKNNRFGIELNGGASFATQKLSEAELNTGFGFEGILQYHFLPQLGVYGGWGWNRFGADDSFAGQDVCFEETGYILGLQFRQALGNSNTTAFLRAGSLYNHIEIENADGDIVKDSGHGFGWQVAGGVEIPLGSNWSVAPGVKFNSLNRDIDLEGSTRELKHNYISARVGIVKRF